MRSHIGWRGERNIHVETSPRETHFKTIRLTVIYNGPKWTISTHVGLERLKMVLKPDTAWWSSLAPKRGGL